MALSIGGSLTNQKQSTNFEQTQTGSQNSSTSASGNQVTSTLDPATIQILQDTIGTLAGAFNDGSQDAMAIRNIAGQLQQNTDPTAVNDMVFASQEAAKQNYAANQGAQIMQLQQVVGSKGHSYSQLIQNMGNADLSTQLAKIVADIRLNAKSQHATELASAMGAYATASQVEQNPLQGLLSAIASLTGAKTETQTEESQLANMFSTMLTKGSSTTKSKGSSIGASLGGS